MPHPSPISVSKRPKHSRTAADTRIKTGEFDGNDRDLRVLNKTISHIMSNNTNWLYRRSPFPSASKTHSANSLLDNGRSPRARIPHE